MNERFILDWERQVAPVINSLIEIFSGADDLLIKAFAECNGLTHVKSVSGIKNQLRLIVGMGSAIPWGFYEAISTLMMRSPKGTKDRILEAVRIPTNHPYEYLTVTEDGRWQIAWEKTKRQDEQVNWDALDWYRPPQRDRSPMVPEPIIDYIAGCFALLNGNLVLPAGAVLSIALEAVLWDALALKGISRLGEKIKYKAVEWKLIKRSSSLIVTINGAEKGLTNLSESIGDYPPKFTLQFRRMQSGEGQQIVTLQAEVDASLIDHLTTAQEDGRETTSQHGLSVAIQRGRKEEVESLSLFPSQLDSILVPLRNNLIHLVPTGTLNDPIPTGEGEISNLSELRANERFIRTLLPWIIELINSVYSGPLEIETEVESPLHLSA